MSRQYYIVGNWKMNQGLQEINQFFEEISHLKQERNYEAWISPQALHIAPLLEKGNPLNIKIGAQNISNQVSGAHTGELSPRSLKDIGASFCLVGHSERRAIYGEDHDFINQKVLLALEEGLKVIFCCGETLEDREKGMTEAVVEHQIDEGLKNLPDSQRKDLIIAYEPVWAIGTGKTASPEQAEEVHAFIREKLSKFWDEDSSQKTPLLYGGSVKPANVDGLLGQNNIDGALVGGASLKANDFMALCSAAESQS